MGRYYTAIYAGTCHGILDIEYRYYRQKPDIDPSLLETCLPGKTLIKRDLSFDFRLPNPITPFNEVRLSQKNLKIPKETS